MTTSKTAKNPASPGFNNDVEQMCDEEVVHRKGVVEWREFWDEKCTDKVTSIWGEWLTDAEREDVGKIQDRIEELEARTDKDESEYWEERRQLYSDSAGILHNAFVRSMTGVGSLCDSQKYEVFGEFDGSNYTEEGCDAGWAGRSRVLCVPREGWISNDARSFSEFRKERASGAKSRRK